MKTEKMLDAVVADKKHVGLVIVAAGFERGLPEFIGRPSTATLLFDDAVDDLHYAIRKVITGEPVITSRLVAPVITNATAAVSRAKAAIDRLAPREREVLRLIGTGRTNQEIARELSLGTTTVKSYVSRLLAKLHLRDRVECALLARQVELLNTRPVASLDHSRG
ncbi:response regulator transcription factor [Actinophytocola sediminis]